jgi:hypothetical protein
MATPLTDGTVHRIAKMFPLTDRDLVSALLIEECGDNLATDPATIERIRFAVLKLSGGDLNVLQRAIDQAKSDWRDVLVVAGFGNDVTAHHSWWPDAPAK